MAATKQNLDLANAHRTIHAGVILLNSVTELADIAPFHFLGSMSREELLAFESIIPEDWPSQALDLQCHWVNETGKPAEITAGMKVMPTDTFDTCPPLDIVLMGASRLDYAPTPAELAFVRKSFADCQAFMSICGGYHAPLLAGVLERKAVAAPIFLIDQLTREHPETEWLGKRWHQDGKFWSSGTLLNGLDCMRAFVLHTWGGKRGMVEGMADLGGWPKRDVDFKDVQAQ